MRFTGRLSFTGSFGLGIVKTFKPERPLRYSVPLDAANVMQVRHETGMAFTEIAERWGKDLSGHGAVSGAIAPMGLSKLSNSEAVRRRRGWKGITSLGRRRVRESCELLQRKYGRGRLSFVTLTMPHLGDEDMGAIALEWPQVIHKLQKAVCSRLRLAGLPGVVVGCSEIQPERSWKERRPVLHIHAVFVGRLPRQKWAISTKTFDQIWATILGNVLGRHVDVQSACQMQSVKKSAAGYLGKYLSKSDEQVDIWANSWYCDWIPASWWFSSIALRRACEALCLRGTELGGMLRWLLDISSSDVLRQFQVTIGCDKVPVGWGGELSEQGLNEIYESFNCPVPSLAIQSIAL